MSETTPPDPYLGRIEASRVKLLRVPRLQPDVIEGFRALGEASPVISDVLDELGIAGAVGASTLRPAWPGGAIVGYALTVRNEREEGEFADKAARNAPMGMHDLVAHNLAQTGDVLVIQGVAGVSNLGGMSAQAGKRQGELGAVVDGGVRDVEHFTASGYPVWSTEVTPITGRWRIRTVEINGAVTIQGIAVAPGDVVVADRTGVCFVPAARAAEVLQHAQKKQAADDERCAAIARGTPLHAMFGNAGRKP